MVLTAALRRLAVDRPHLLVVEGSGGVAARFAVERWARERGWPLVVTPADADLLVVAGSTTAIQGHVGRVWDQLPGPRGLVWLDAQRDVPAALEQGQSALADLATQRADAQQREQGLRPGADDPHAGHDMSSMDMSAAEPAEADPHAGHDMSSMAMPAGLPMAGRAEDRDGLKLDVLTVPLGPVLAWWPAGLVVTVVLQGDVVQQAQADLLGDTDERRAGWAAALRHLAPPAAAAVVRLDALVRLLAVAGWDGPRLSCQQLRDTLLAGSSAKQAAPDARQLVRRISRSRLLSRMTVGIPLTQDEDLTARYHRWGTEILAALDHGTLPPPADEAHAVHQLPALLTGTEFASARLVIAGLDLALSGADVMADARV